MWQKRAFRTRMPKRRTSRIKRHNMARLNTWPRPRQGTRGKYGREYRNFRQQGATTSKQNGEGASTWIATAHVAQSNYSQGRLGNEIQWLLDSGCTDHIINSEDYFNRCIDLKEPVNIYLGDNRYIKATKIGNVVSYFDAFRKQNDVNMSNVLYAEKMSTNLISFGKLTDNNKIISKGNIAKIIDTNNEHTKKIELKIKSTLKHRENFDITADCSNNNMSLKEKWHRMLGHVNFGYLDTLCEQELLTGIPNEFESEFRKCKTCI